MNTVEQVKSIVDGIFQNEECSNESITAYITGNGVLFGICEESDDLEYLEKTYEQPSR